LPKVAEGIYRGSSMGVSAITIEGTSPHSEEVVRRVSAGLSRLSNPSAVIVFAMGRLGKCLDEIAQGIKNAHPRVCAVVAETEGLFTERGELEGKDGFGCLLHSGRPVRLTSFSTAFGPFEKEGEPPDDYRIQVQPESELGPKGPSFYLFSEFPSDYSQLSNLSFDSDGLGWFGAVTTSESPIWTVSSNGDVGPAKAVRLEWTAMQRPLVVSSACCRIVSQPMTVTSIAGTTLLELDHTPALVALGQVTAKLPERSWIVIALPPDEGMTTELTVDASPHVVKLQAEGTNHPLFRPLRGIDPSRGALVLREPLPRGARVAFAVRDDRAAKRALDEALRKTRMQLGGATPRFGLYFEGLGRGRPLFGASNVELSLLRQTLGTFPILGSRSTLELNDVEGKVVAQAMSGQLALFVSPS
jgi:hypothetical protein